MDTSLARLGTEYVTCCPSTGQPEQDRYVQAWEGHGRQRSVAASKVHRKSNFKPAHLERIIDATATSREVNQFSSVGGDTQRRPAATTESTASSPSRGSPLGGRATVS